jgi:hypothetical protein
MYAAVRLAEFTFHHRWPALGRWLATCRHIPLFVPFVAARASLSRQGKRIRASQLNMSRSFQSLSILLLTVLPGWAAKAPLEREFDAPPDRVYAAMVEAAGAELISAVKEGCLVNLRVWVSTNFSQGEYRGNVVCHAAEGKTVVNIEVQTVGTGDFRRGSMFRGPAGDKFARVYWAKLDKAVASLASSPAATGDPVESRCNG